MVGMGEDGVYSMLTLLLPVQRLFVRPISKGQLFFFPF